MDRRPWTKKETDAIRERYRRDGPTVLGAELQRTRQSVSSEAYRMGVIGGVDGREKMRARHEAILRKHWMTEIPSETAKRINRSLPFATAFAVSLGLPPDTWVRQKGRNNGRGKITYAAATIAPPKRLKVTPEDVRWALEVGLGNPEARRIAWMLATGNATVTQPEDAN